jgi:hypothetical protein
MVSQKCYETILQVCERVKKRREEEDKAQLEQVKSAA